MVDNALQSTSPTVPTLPVDQILVNLAHSVVQAQAAMDTASLATEVRIREQGLDERFGLSSHWYTIPQVDFELRLAFEVGSRGEVTTQMVDAEYQNKYGFSLQASSLLTTRIVATPPPEGRGFAMLDERSVLQTVGRLKRVVVAYSEADTPYFSVLYRAFAPQGYAGGLWYALLLDKLASGATEIRAVAVVDDASGEVVRLWLDEPVTVNGVVFTAREAVRALGVANVASEETLRDGASLSASAAANLVAARPFVNLDEVSAVDQIGPASLERLRDFDYDQPPPEEQSPDG